MPEKSTTIPRQKTAACTMLSRRPPDCRFRKYDIVMGIIGKTQGVKIDASPKPNATSRNAARLWSEGRGPESGRGGDASVYPAGMARASAAGVTGTLPDHRDGTHCVSLQVWYRTFTSTDAGVPSTAA